MTQLVINNLTKSFNNNGLTIDVIKGISFSVDSGERLAILGSSGAGKSTLLHILGTLEEPTSGEVLYEGRNPFDHKGQELADFRNRHVGFVFQFHHLLADFNALENVMMPLLIGGMDFSLAQKKASALLDQVGLSERLYHAPAQLSGGEQQRIAIARACVTQPQVLLADEPTGNLDEANGSKVFDLLLELNKELKITLIVVTHNEEAIRPFDRSLRLVDGQILNP